MEFLIDNPLATLYGPYFLVLYGLVIALSVIAVAFVRSNLDQTDRLSLPSIPPQPDPFETAYLRGGANELARSVIFALVQKGFVEISNDGKKAKIRTVSDRTDTRSLSPIEIEGLNWIRSEREVSDVFMSKNGLVDVIEPHASVYHSSLQNRQFLFSTDAAASARRAGRIGAVLIAGLGGYKFLAAIANGNFNVVFLVIFGIVGTVICLAAGRLPRITKHGKIYLERLQLAFENLKYQSQAPYIKSAEPRVIGQPTMAGVDPLLVSVGLFGTGILTGTVFDSYNTAFHRAQQATGSSGGSCGSSCGSCSSGGSCSGGSGCGGCGGGCGG